MTQQGATEQKDKGRGDLGNALRRRGLLAAGWAALAAVGVKLTTQSVEADGTQGTPLTIGVLNTETAATNLKWAGAQGVNSVLMVANDTSFAPTGAAFPAALAGWANASASAPYAGVPNGVYGYLQGGTGNAVVGVTIANGSNGVLGANYASGAGVRGEINAASNQAAIAVYGVNNSSFVGGAPGAGGFGVYGRCAKGHGLVGATQTAGGAAVVGATNGVVDAYAAVFYGPVAVNGDFTVFGGAKSAAVPHPDGSHRRVYCMESPESWFEDFGEGQLVDGRAEIKVDPDFAAIVDMEKYHVFLTAYSGDHDGLHVPQRAPGGFSVEAKGGGCGEFSWRIVAKRKDIAGERMAKVPVMPAEPQPPVLAPIPENVVRP